MRPSLRRLASVALMMLPLTIAFAGAAAAKTVKKAAAPPAKSALEGVDLFQVTPAHSPIEFSIAWMGLSRVRGAFPDFAGTLALDRNDMTRSSITIVIKTKSLTTFNERRDRDLKSADWFDVEKYPLAVFSSREIVKDGEGYRMHGTLSLHGETRELDIPFTFNGRLKDTGGDDRAGFEGQVALNRKDFGIVGPARYNALTELGKAMVGNEVQIPLAVEAWRAVAKDTMFDRTADSLWRAVVARGVPAVAKDYREQRTRMPDSLMAVNDGVLNAVGHQLLQKGRAATALEMFKLETDSFPQSAFALVGIAQAHAVLGDRANAAAFAEKAVAVNPSATRAIEILRRTRDVAPN